MRPTPQTSSQASGKLKKKWVYIPVEVKVRCFHARLLLACQAADAGFGVVLGSQRAILDALPFLPPGILLDKCLSLAKERFYENMRRMGHRIASLDEEGLVYTDPEVWAHLRASEANLDRSAAVFTWGPAQQQIFETHYPNHVDRVIATGNPRIDLLRPEFRELFRESAQSIRDRHGRFVFMPSNHCVHMHAAGPGFIRKHFARLGYAKPEDRIRFESQRFEAHLTAMKEITQAFPDLRIIIRPHPGEDQTMWHTLVQAYRNVVVEAQGTIDPYLMAAEAVVHNGCTSAIQAVVMDRPVIAYQPVTHEDYDQKLPNSVSLSTADPGQLIQAVRDVVNGTHSRDPQVDRILRHHLSSLDGPFAYVRIVEALRGIDIEPVHFRFKRLKQAVMKAPRRTALTTLSILSSRTRRLVQYERQKCPRFSTDEVRRNIRHLGALAGSFDRISATPLADDLYLFEQQPTAGQPPRTNPKRRTKGSVGPEARPARVCPCPSGQTRRMNPAGRTKASVSPEGSTERSKSHRPPREC